MKYKQLEDLLDQISGCTFAGMDTTTIPALKGGKKNLMQGRITKISKNHRVMLFTNKNMNAYNAMVRRRLIAENKNPDGFVLGPLKWGTRLPESPVIVHNDNHYLQCVFLHSGSVEYQLDGQHIDKDDIEGLIEAAPSEKQGLDDEVIVRTFNLDNIDSIRLMGETVDTQYPVIFDRHPLDELTSLSEKKKHDAQSDK